MEEPSSSYECANTDEERDYEDNNGSNWVNFELGEDVRDERRLEQDRLWAQAVADGRVHLSHREFALRYGHRFLAAIEDYETIKLLILGMYGRRSILRKLAVETLTMIVEYAFPGQALLVRSITQNMEIEKTLSYLLGNAKNDAAQGAFRICVRKRPLLPFERSQGSYEVAHCQGNHSIRLHEGKMARNGRLLSMSHHQFAVDNVYDEKTSNDELCRQVVEPLLSWASRGKKATMLCFGQTGTGKTYTLYAALEYISKHLIGKQLKLIFYEVHGNKCYDLLSDRKLVHLRFDENETLHVRGAKQIEIMNLSDPKELLQHLTAAIKLRSTLVTERNSLSSRSHAVCTIEIIDPSAPKKDYSLQSYLKEKQGVESGESVSGGRTGGKITLVDLAGSERNYETVQMSAAQHKESADINLALMSLKDCFRAYHSSLFVANQKESEPPTTITSTPGGNSTSTKSTTTVRKLASPYSPRIPYRSSTLTKVLKDCFTNGYEHHTTIIATISPTPTDLQHSLNTINHVLLMSANLASYYDCVTVEVPKSSEAALSSVPIAQWSPAQVIGWITTVERGRFSHLVLPPATNGARLLELTVSNFTQLFEEQERLGRQEKEGPVWTISTEENSRLQAISLALFNAIRREEYIQANKVNYQHDSK